MKPIYILILVITIWVAGNCFADSPRHGYVLKPGEGETTEVPDSLIKASPKSGTQGGVVIRQGMPHGGSTGLHYHIHADEFFYIAEGEGQVTIGKEVHAISAGDFIFVPSGQDHRLTAGEAGLVIIEFLDKPGLDEEFRTPFDGEMTLYDLNRIGRKYGTIYKTID